MKEKSKDDYDFSDFLLDDEFVNRISDQSNLDIYLAELKAQFPAQEKNIDLALQVIGGMKNSHVFSTQSQREKVWSGIIGVFSGHGSRRIGYSSDPLTSKTHRMRNFLRVAAGILMLLGIGVSFLYFQKERGVSIDRFASSTEVSYDRPQLILSDGKKIEVSTGEASIHYSADGSNVTINDTTGVIQPLGNDRFNQVIVPYGKYVSMQLSDGTKVWLNSGSRMVYPPVFKGKQREVYLQGEGYFEVAKNTKRPFYVKTDRLRIEVLGTKFDVQAYEKENEYSALLLEGKVSLSVKQRINRDDIVLKPGERGGLSETSDHFIVEKVVNPQNYIAWTYGYLNFDEESLESLLKRVSRHYNIDIQVQGDRGSFKISGKLDLKENPERVLKGLAMIAKMKMSKKEGGFIISD